MRQIVIDELSREERANIESFLRRTVKPGSMEDIYWLPLPDDLWTAEQREHSRCSPFSFAIELKPDAVSFELLVRSQASLHCSCIGFATAPQREFLLRFVDKMVEEEGVRT